MDDEKDHIICFKEFELHARRRSFLRSGKSVPLTAKALDLLLFLAKNAGRVISKEEIMDVVWKDQFVEETNLAVQISALRKALGDRVSDPRYLATIPGRGYQFIADVSIKDPSSDEEAEIFVANAADHDSSKEFAAEENRRGRSKLIPRYVAVVVAAAVLTSIAVTFFLGREYFSPEETINSIAVLPFANQTGDPASDYLSDGLAESVIFSLSRMPYLRVMSRDSSFRYRDAAVDARTVGSELKVQAILTGRIVQVGDSISARAELVSTVDNSIVWGEQFTRELADIEKLQIDIARSIVRELRVKLADSDERILERNQTEDHEAFQLYLTGRYHLNRLTDDGFFKGRDSFRAAIAKDPDYALAHSGLADAFNLLSGWGAIAPNDGFPLAKASAARALELGDDLAEAHTQMGIVKLFYDLNWEESEKEFTRAIRINPSYSDAHHMYAYSLMLQGRFEEAKISAGKAIDLDPLSAYKMVTIGNIFTFERNNEEAISQYKKALEMDPNSGLARWSLGNAYLHDRQLPEAIREFETAIRLSGNSPDEPASLAVAYALSGNAFEARRIIDDLSRRSEKGYVSPALFAIIYGALGERDKAFEYLEKAARERDPLLAFLKIDPYFDPLRSDPRFAELMKRVGPL